MNQRIEKKNHAPITNIMQNITGIKLKLVPSTNAHLGMNFCFSLILTKESISCIITEMFWICFMIRAVLNKQLKERPTT